MKMKNFFKHIFLVFRHKNKVFVHCVKCGIIWRGIVHDLSKFSPTELFESVKYYRGNRSPIGVCRRETGISRAWLHHKGRNKHHIEYWTDFDLPENPVMPYKSAVECALAHWLRYGNKVPGNPKTMRFIETVFTDLAENGEKYILNKKYMKSTYKRICVDEN